jgi:hypothetical protein
MVSSAFAASTSGFSEETTALSGLIPDRHFSLGFLF